MRRPARQGSARRAPRRPAHGFGADPAARGRIFGFHRAADTTGAVIGPTLGLILYELLGPRIRPLLLIAVLPAVLSVLLVAAVHDDKADSGDKSWATKKLRASKPELARPGQLPAHLRRLIAVLTLFSLVNFPDALLLLRAHELGLSTAGVIAAYIVYNIVYAASSYPAGALSDRLPRQVVFAAGLGFCAVGYLGLGLTHTPALVFVLLPIYGGFAACTDGVGKAWIASLAPDNRQGAAQGLYQGLTGDAVLLAGFWAGLAWNGTGQTPLIAAGTVGAIAALGMLLFGNHLNVAQKPSSSARC